MTKKISIRKRLSWYVIVATLAMLMVTGTGVYIATTDEADEIFDAKMAQTASDLERFVSRESIASIRKRQENAPKHSTNSQTGEEQEYEKKSFFLVRDDDGNNLLNSHLAVDLGAMKNKQGYLRLEIEGDEWITYTHKSNQDDLWIIVGE